MKYLIWSNKHRNWWRARRSGYTDYIEEAGRYSKQEALKIVNRATASHWLGETRRDPVTGETYVGYGTWAVPAPEEIRDGPQVVLVIGPSEARETIADCSHQLAMAGHVTLTRSFAYTGQGPAPQITDAVQEAMDLLLPNQVDLADIVLVVNTAKVDLATNTTAAYAHIEGKKVRHLVETHGHVPGNDGACVHCGHEPFLPGGDVSDASS